MSFAPIAYAASPIAYTSGCETERMVSSTTIWPVSVTRSAVAFARVDREAGGPHRHRGRDGPPVGGADPVGLDAGDVDVLVRGDAEPAEDLPQVPAALGREPVTEVATGDEGDLQVGAGLGDLGRRLHAGQAAADDGHRLPGRQRRQPLAQPEGTGPAGEFVGVLGDTGDAVGAPAAAEGVDEGVVRQLAGAVLVGDGDGPAVHVDAGDPGDPYVDTGAGEHPGQRPGLELLADRQLVHPDPLHEVGFGVDEGDGDVRAVQSSGEATGGEGSGVTGAEDDDAVRHVRAPVCCGFAT
ncbi:hypothetical protein GCM10027605_36010 [Micromonospora zhanjiangensis]